MGKEPMKGFRKVIIQLVLALLVLAVGVGGFRFLKSMKKPPVKKPAVVVKPLVEVIKVEAADTEMDIQGYGTVKAKYEAEVVAEVSGQIIEYNLEEGGFFKAGQELVKIDPRDYELAVESAKAAVKSAEVLLQQEEAEAAVARAEWDEIHPGKEPDSPLVLREPQIGEAKAKLLSAKSDLAKAKLDLERTSVSLPFDGRVIEESIDLGQFVNKGQSIANVYGTKVVEIQLPLEDDELEWFTIGENGSSVEVSAMFGGKQQVWQGKVVRSGGMIDPKSRMVDVIIEVENPFDVSEGGWPLTPGMFVDISIKGKVIKNAIRVPRGAIHDRSQIWVSKDEKLDIRDVEIARSDRDYAYIVDGLQSGELVVISSIDAAVDGMGLRLEVVETSQNN